MPASRQVSATDTPSSPRFDKNAFHADVRRTSSGGVHKLSVGRRTHLASIRAITNDAGGPAERRNYLANGGGEGRVQTHQ